MECSEAQLFCKAYLELFHVAEKLALFVKQWLLPNEDLVLPPILP